MIIGIDIDDTITNHLEVWLDIYNEYCRDDNDPILQVSDAYKWSFYDDYSENTKNNLLKSLSYQGLYFDKIRILNNVKNTIQELIDSGNQIYFISATSKEYQDKKKEWLLNELPMIDESNIIFSEKKELFNVDIMIDDNLSYASKFKCPFILFKRPWNSNREPELYTDNILICSNWDEIESYFISQNVIVPEAIDKEVVYSKATTDLIEGIKNAKTNQECIDILNPYITMWQEQGILIGISRMSDFLGRFAEDVEKEINNNQKT